MYRNVPPYVIYFADNYTWMQTVIVIGMHKDSNQYELFVEIEQLINDLLQILLNVAFATQLHVIKRYVNDILHCLFVVPRLVRNCFIVHALLVDFESDECFGGIIFLF